MLSKAGLAIFIAGNKSDGAGGVVEASRVLREFEIAVERGVYPIPIGATGHAAKALSERVLGNLDKYFPDHASKVKAPLQTLADGSAGEDQWLEAVFSIIKLIAPK